MKSLVDFFEIPDVIVNGRQIISWWESKRPKFNFCNLFALFIGLGVLSMVNYSLINFFLLPFIIAIGVFINVVYSLGWVIGIIVFKVNNGADLRPILSFLIVSFFVLSVFSTFSICLVFLIFNIP